MRSYKPGRRGFGGRRRTIILTRSGPKMVRVSTVSNSIKTSSSHNPCATTLIGLSGPKNIK